MMILTTVMNLIMVKVLIIVMNLNDDADNGDVESNRCPNVDKGDNRPMVSTQDIFPSALLNRDQTSGTRRKTLV